MNRITWEMGQYSTEVGYVNGLRLFSIAPSMRRHGGNCLQTTLPVKIREGRDVHKDRDVLKERAESILKYFAERIGTESQSNKVAK